MKISKLPTDTRRHARLVVLAVALCVTSCDVNPETKCNDEGPHEWGKWELTETPSNYFKDIEVQRRTCEKCGYTMRESNGPK
jgi:hypothetical protein